MTGTMSVMLVVAGAGAGVDGGVGADVGDAALVHVRSSAGSYVADSPRDGVNVRRWAYYSQSYAWVAK